MSLFRKGIILLIVHILIVSSLGAKLLYDRVTLPRVWVRAIPFDPDLPIRGRYIQLQLVVEISDSDRKKEFRAVTLHAKDGKLFGEPQINTDHNPSDLSVRHINKGNKQMAILLTPVAFFIAEHLPDPSQTGEELWVEATIPQKGLPRPIRLKWIGNHL